MKGWQKTASTAGSKEQLLWKSRKERNQYSSKTGTTKEQVEKSSGPPNQTRRCKQGASQLPGTAGEATEEEQRYSQSSKHGHKMTQDITLPVSSLHRVLLLGPSHCSLQRSSAACLGIQQGPCASADLLCWCSLLHE